MADRISFHYLRGALYGIACVCIWAGYIVVARLGIRTSLTPWDIAAVRFAVAGAILMPVVLRHGVALDRLGWSGTPRHRPGRRRTDGPVRQCRARLCAGGTGGRAVSRRRAADGGDPRGDRAEGGILGDETARARSRFWPACSPCSRSPARRSAAWRRSARRCSSPRPCCGPAIPSPCGERRCAPSMPRPSPRRYPAARLPADIRRLPAGQGG